MSDEKIIPTDAPEAENAATPAEAAEVVNETEETTHEPEMTSEESNEATEESSETPSETEEAPATSETSEESEATPVRATPLTALSARAERPSRGKSSGDKGGDRGGRRDDRRGGGKSGFEPVKKEFEEVLLEVGRVTKVTSGGRQLRFRAAVVIGDRNGRVGFGLGKAREVSIAVEKAVNSAKRNLIKVPLENGTVPFQVETKFKSVKIMIHPATEGTGIIAGGSARRILELAGCQNILSKRHGGRNVITTAYATMDALKKYQVKN